MDIDSRSETCCILTYSYLLVYRKNSSESWEQAVQRAPAIRQLPLMQQAESLCFSDNGQNLFVTSEKTPAPVFRISTP
ncbi:MAG: hypothetical protein U5R06_12445 [candidate division KSB1 bacterium]|nr:hypothetical protein [candidate division KSB1 bacterium]